MGLLEQDYHIHTSTKKRDKYMLKITIVDH